MVRKVSPFVSTMRLLHPEWGYHEDTRSNHHKENESYAGTKISNYVSKFDAANFVAIDGEGINTGIQFKKGDALLQEQRYVLMKNSLGDRVVDLQGLPTTVCLDFLLDSAKTKSVTLVCYGASYDVNMMVRDLPEAKLKQLHARKRVFYGHYILDYTPRKSFSVAKFHRQWNAEKHENDIIIDKSVILWDVFSFFQASFVKTLKSYFTSKVADMSAKERYEKIIPLIEQGKNERRVFTQEQLESFIEPYCKMEVDALVELMQVFHGYLKKAGLVLSRWDGAGAVAGAMLKKYKVKPHIDESLFPQEVILAAEYAYFGGRIEALQCGNYDGTVYHYDINSAYPSSMIDIPSFIGGKWIYNDWGFTYQDVFEAPAIAMFYIQWEYIGKYLPILNPFPWRAKDGRVYFPDRGRAWVHKPELEVALKYCSKDYSIEIMQSWMFYPATPTVYPYDFIPEVYKLRQEAIANGDGTQIVYKLGMNSLYGKTAQSKGYNFDTKQKPPYHNLVVAGEITSRTRASLMEAAMQAPDKIIFLATDGIYSTVPLDLPGTTSEVKQLGQWEYKTHDYLTLFMSGVYWLGNSDKEEDAYSRGYDKSFKNEEGKEIKFKELRPYLLQAWADGQKSYSVPCTRFVTIGSAVGLNDFGQHCYWRTINRELDLTMERVAKSRIRTRDKIKDRSKQLIRAYPEILPEMSDSTKYAFDWDGQLIDGLTLRTFNEEVWHSKE